MTLRLITKTDNSFTSCVDIDFLTWFDGNLISTDSGGAVKTWSPELKLLDEFNPHDEYPVYHLASNEANKSLFTCSSDSNIHEWRREGGKWKLINTLHGHGNETIRRIHVNGNQLFSGDEAGQVKVWENGKIVANLDMMEEVSDMLVFENILITVRNRDVVLSELVTSKSEGYRCSVKQVLEGRPPLFLTENNQLCFAERNGIDVLIVKQFHSSTPNINKLQGHKLIINAITGSGNKLFSGGWDKKVIAWDLEKSQIIGDVETDGYINAMTVKSLDSNFTEENLYVAGENSFIGIIQISS